MPDQTNDAFVLLMCAYVHTCRRSASELFEMCISDLYIYVIQGRGQLSAFK